MYFNLTKRNKKETRQDAIEKKNNVRILPTKKKEAKKKLIKSGKKKMNDSYC